MRQRTIYSSAGLLALSFLISSAVPATSAEDAENATSDVGITESRVEQMQRDMEEMQRQLEETQQQLEEMKSHQTVRTETKGEETSDGELERLRRLADEEPLPAEEALPTDRSFIARGLGLQTLNPEISLAGDFLMFLRARENERTEMDFQFRVLDIHLESYLDPYSKMKAAIGVNPGGAKLGEAYFTRFGVLPGLSITAGKFRQQFGVVNRWHKHALDQVDFPLALRQIFGEGGLNQSGLSFDWSLPELWGASHQAMVQVTEGENDRVFGENPRGLPSILARYNTYRDLSKDTYLDIGLTGLTGWNDEWEYETLERHSSRQTWVAGADLTIRWEPTERMRYANLEWRSELYYLNKGIVAPADYGQDRIIAWGAYTSLQRQITRTVELGVRLDYFEPDSKDYASLNGFEPLAVVGSHPRRWQVGPYITWWQSPFVRFRFETDYSDGHRTGPAELTFVLQVVFAAGPHKHERY
jgi:hypothetical protein